MNASVDLSVELAGIRLKNPVMTASGTFGYGPEYADVVDFRRLGAVVVKGISKEPVAGNLPPRTVEVACGLINSIGLQNPGVEGFIREYLPFWRTNDVPLIVNIWGRDVEEYAAVAERLSAEDRVTALEVNVSCPNIKEGSALFGGNLDLFRRVVGGVRKKSRIPMIVKLAPELFRIKEFARAAEEEGADAISVTNTLPAMAVDIETRKPKLGNITGGLSGPAIKPVAVKLVWEVARSVRIPVVGMGGITTASDALEFLMVGATAVAVGTANFLQPDTAIQIIEGLERYLVEHGLDSVRKLIGCFST